MAILSKKEILDVLMRMSGETRSTCERVYDATTEMLHDGMLAGHEFRIQGFGTFQVKVRPAARKYDPYHQTFINAPERKGPYMRWSPTLKKEFREQGSE